MQRAKLCLRMLFVDILSCVCVCVCGVCGGVVAINCIVQLLSGLLTETYRGDACEDSSSSVWAISTGGHDF